MSRFSISIAIFSAVGVAAVVSGAQCTGKFLEPSGFCSNARFCVTNDTNDGCKENDAIKVEPVKTCESGVAADNCVVTTTSEVCASQWTCTFGIPPGEAQSRCYRSAMTGQVTHKMVTDGGNCSVGS